MVFQLLNDEYLNMSDRIGLSVWNFYTYTLMFPFQKISFQMFLLVLCQALFNSFNLHSLLLLVPFLRHLRHFVRIKFKMNRIFP